MLTAAGQNIYIENLSRDLTIRSITGQDVSLDTHGSVNTTDDGMIRAKNLAVTALGNIGTETHPMRINVNGKTEFSNLMGRTWVTNFANGWRWLIDEEWRRSAAR